MALLGQLDVFLVALAQPVRSLRARLSDRARGAKAALQTQSSLLPAAWVLFILLELFALAVLVLSYKHVSTQPVALESEPGPWNVSSLIDPTKVAFLLETRTSNMLVPLLLHYISVTPPDWLFIFMGSPGAVTFMASLPSIQRQVASGKLELQLLPSNVTINSQETLSRFYTNPWTYSHLLPTAEVLYVFQNDAMVCANTHQDLNDWTQYSWVGAPWRGSADGGNGGLSLRNATAMRWVTSIDQRIPGTEPEDVWMVTKFHQYGVPNMCPSTKEREFSSEGFYYRHPMGYHTGGGGQWLATGLWGTPELRHEAYSWCPEVKMLLDMDAAEYVPGHCNDRWDGV